MTNRINLFGVQIDNLSLSETLDRVAEFVRTGKAHQHVVVNVDKVIKLSKSPTLRQIILDCDLVNADGMPIVWASKLLGQPLKERVAGVDLFVALVERAAQDGWPIYLLGAEPAIVERVKTRFQSRYPNLQIAGYRDGYWTDDQEHEVIDKVCSSGAKLLFVAIGSPKKEILLSAIQARGVIPFSMGVGGSFDVVAGKVKRAPIWMQRSGLEWFYRFAQEPHRLFKRYFVDAFRFAGIFASECWIRIKSIFKLQAG